MKATYKSGYIFITGNVSEVNTINSLANELIKTYGFVDTDCYDIDDYSYTISLKTYETITESKRCYKLAKQAIKNN